MRLSTEVNRYIDFNAPWTSIKTDRDAAALTVYTALKAIDSLKILFAPILPFSCEKLHGFFGYTEPLFGEQYVETLKDSLGEHTALRYKAPLNRLEGGYWHPSQLKPGQALTQPMPLFKKLDESVAVEERARMGV